MQFPKDYPPKFSNSVFPIAQQVSEYDCLLLEFVFGQRPDDALKVKSHVLESIAADPELQKAEILFLGSFGRACEFLSAGDAEVGGSFETNPTIA